MKRIAAGILAHVDAGKTTLSEGLLYCAGEIRKLGRVDTQNTFLDTNEIERKRGITIFSKQAVINVDDTVVTLVDTPGHVDFSAEAERTLSVLDYAILVVSATDGVQSHTKTLWQLLKKHSIPVFVFVNKMDLAGADMAKVIDDLKNELNSNFVDFTDTDKDQLCENIAMCDEDLMQSFLENGTVKESDVIRAIYSSNICPCFCGSALKMEGVESFLKAFVRLTHCKTSPAEFGAKVFKISQDDKGQRLSFVKITGGSLKVKDLIATNPDFNEKVNEIRIYSGDKYKSADEVFPGSVCALTGLTKTYAGQGLGFEGNSDKLTLEPIFSYRVILPKGTDATTALSKLRQLQQEETQLNVSWNEHLKEIQIRIMGEIQLEVLKQLILKRFDMDVEFEEGRILYKETIENRVEGVGHYEPLRHYSEVHLVLEPGARGSGMQFTSDCSEDDFDKNWQRLILTHLMEKTHIGVLTGSPITDIKITLKSGRAHKEHTDGGDFRQATHRAVRHGLRMAKSLLLEPYYSFELTVPNDNVGRAMTDLDMMGADFTMPLTRGDVTKLSGTVAANAIRNYHKELVGYTHGKGKLSCKFNGYDVCKNADEVIQQIGYDVDADLENTADSVFCSHGAGFNVRWDEVTNHMHLESVLKPKKKTENSVSTNRAVNISASDDELLKIFERTYGKIQETNPNMVLKTQRNTSAGKTSYHYKATKSFEKEYLLVDGYNIIFAWDALKEISKDSLEAARSKLIEKMSTYKLFKKCEVIVVFDAYKVKGNRGEVEKHDGVTVVYTKEAQTADSYIEKAAKELSRNYKVTVATSDGLEQLIIFGTGAYRMPARILQQDVEMVEESITQMLESYNISAEKADFYKIFKDKFKDF
ncbi:MAG: TetM/TetW/TetO/TetS family tetracycline resistance ribosomal protection protein [Clostridia bacterium]|nr:TetM/TetW/TetO/TetS family tetracycline resistance ribosomal protection protein [Clostridia bacterium]